MSGATVFALASGSVDAILYDSLSAGDRLSSMQRVKGMEGAATQLGSVVAYSIAGVIAADLTLPRITMTIVMGALAVSTATDFTWSQRHGARSAPIAPCCELSCWRSSRVRSGRTCWCSISSTFSKPAWTASGSGLA